MVQATREAVPIVATVARTRTVDEVLLPSADELLLVSMVEIALMYAHDKVIAARDTDRYLGQLTAKDLPTNGLSDFATQLAMAPRCTAWHSQLLEQMGAVTPSRQRIWLAMQSVWGVYGDIVEGPVMRRMDALLDLTDFDGSALEIQFFLEKVLRQISQTGLDRAAKASERLRGSLSLIGAGLKVHDPTGGIATGAVAVMSGAATGLSLLHQRLTNVDEEARTISETVLAGTVAAAGTDGHADADRLLTCLREDLFAATAGTTTDPRRATMLRRAVKLLEDVLSGED